MNFLKMAIAGIFLIATIPTATAESKYPIPSPPTVKVETSSGWCTGVHVGDGFFLTARHCFDQLSFPSNWEVSIQGEDTYIKWAWKTHDVALLKVPALTEYPSAKVSCKMPAIGDPVKAEGVAADIGWVITFGAVAGLKTEDKNEPHMFIHTADVAPGMSGGPLWNTDGEVIAINVALLNANTGFTYASPISKFCREIPGTDEYIEQQKKVKK